LLGKENRGRRKSVRGRKKEKKIADAVAKEKSQKTE